MRNGSNTQMLAITKTHLCCPQKKHSGQIHTLYPHYLLPHIPAEEEACLFELPCLLKTFQCGFPTLRVVLVAGGGGGGRWA